MLIDEENNHGHQEYLRKRTFLAAFVALLMMELSFIEAAEPTFSSFTVVAAEGLPIPVNAILDTEDAMILAATPAPLPQGRLSQRLKTSGRGSSALCAS